MAALMRRTIRVVVIIIGPPHLGEAKRKSRPEFPREKLVSLVSLWLLPSLCYLSREPLLNPYSRNL
jgi:hypothetical protein